jgi:hypothetical protein
MYNPTPSQFISGVAQEHRVVPEYWRELAASSTSITPKQLEDSYKAKAEWDDLIALSNDKYASAKFYSAERLARQAASEESDKPSAKDDLSFVPGFVGLPGTTTYSNHARRTTVNKTNEVTDFPFPEPQLGLKPALRLLKVTLNSDTRINSEGSGSDFVVRVANLVRNRPVTNISLGDVAFPGGQYLLEDQWNHAQFQEGITCDNSLRSLTIRWPTDGDFTQVLMPLPVNYITNVEVDSLYPYSFILTFAEPVATNIRELPNIWSSFKGTILFTAFRITENGDFILTKEDVVRFESYDGFLHKIRFTVSEQAFVSKNMENTYNHSKNVIITNNVCIDGTLNATWGAMILSPIPSTEEFCHVLNRMTAGAVLYRKDPFTNETIVSNRSITFTLTFKWNERLDKGEIQYTSRSISKVLPVLEGQGILQFLGFNAPFTLNPTNISSPLDDANQKSNPTFGSAENLYINVLGNHTQQRNANAGTNVQAGDYATNIDFANATQDAFNGSWFGPEANIPDENVNPYPQFLISFEESNGVTFTASVRSGRYTPHEVANQIELQVPFLKVTPIFDAAKQNYQGMVFSRNDSLPFAFIMRFEDTALTTINPRRFGFDRVSYSGHTTYDPPRACYPSYPNMYQAIQTTRHPVSQHYFSRVESFSNQLLINGRAFEPRPATVLVVDNVRNFMEVEFQIAHGRVAGAFVVVSDKNSPDPIAKKGLSGIVAPPQALKSAEGTFVGYQYNNTYDPVRGFVGSLYPHRMTIFFGGCQTPSPFAAGDIVRVAFGTTACWSLDATDYVDRVIDQRVLGAEKKFYTVTRPNMTLRFPNPIRLEPESHVYMTLAVNRQGEEGSTMGYFNNKNQKVLGASTGPDSVNAFARLLVGPRSVNKYLDVYDRLFEIKTNAFRNLDTLRIQFRNPNGTLYNFHGNPTSVTLTLNLVEENMRTTLG